MTTINSRSESACHLDKLPHVEWDNTTPGPSRCMFPDGLSPLECQMAGHPFDGKRHTIGMLRKRNGHILKPATKAIIGEREIEFYENLQTCQDPTIAQLKNFVPCYYGTTELKVFNKRTKFLTLKDITEGMAEPCVMDIKIGRRTWDPLATSEKKATEELKYAESKRAYGFCITGFQVYCLSTGRLKKFDRDYGKKLDAKGVVEALETFLNITPERPACRQLIVKLLSFLGQVMLFFRTQRKYRFYSSSLLVAYDARRLRQHSCLNEDPKNFDENFDESARSKSVASEPSNCTILSDADVSKEAVVTPRSSIASVLDTRIAKRNRTEAPSNPMLQRNISLNSTEFAKSIEDKKISNRSGSCCSDLKVDHQSCPTQRCTNNFDEMKMKNNDRDVLTTNETLEDSEKHDWVRVNMIDFTHVFPADDKSPLDLNYLEGIENLFKLVKTFLPREDNSNEKNSRIHMQL